jgi:Flp pilus assembly protein TadD
MLTALTLNPHHTQLFCLLAELAMVHCMLGEHHEAVQRADSALIRRPAYWYAHAVKVNALFRMGDTNAAKLAHGDFRAAHPSFKLDYVDWLPFADRQWIRFLKEGLAETEP